VSAELPSHARVVIIGGGVIGAAIAYHLAELGWGSEVVLVERDRLTSGTTWHAAGLMTTFGSTSETNTQLRLYSRDLYAKLGELTGQDTGFKPVGLIEAATDRDRLEEYRRVAAFQSQLGLEVHEISPTEIAEKFPWAKTDDLLAGFWVPHDGRVNPVDLTTAFAKGARAKGVQLIEGTPATAINTRPSGRVTAVQSVSWSRGEHSGTVECEYVVNCTGMWARELAAQNNLVVPHQAAEHYYLITDTIEGLSPDAPIFEDPAAYGYYREEGGGMMVGLFEPVATPWRVEGVPRDFSFGQITPDWERMLPFLEKAMARVPITQEVGVKTLFCGPESFTPDLAPAVGEAPGIKNYFVTAGMNSVGILSAGGLGRIMAHWITTGRPDVDVTGFHVNRFGAYQAHPTYRAARTAEVLGTVYAAHTPGKQLKTARGQLLSPVHRQLVTNGGYLREVSGWEAADWFGGPGVRPQAEPTWGHAPWFANWQTEHSAVRNAVGLMDLSFMAKFAVTGSDADTFVMRLCAGQVAGPIGRITYTQMLNEDGRIVADLTVLRQQPQEFLVIASDTAYGQVWDLLGRGVGVDEDVQLADVTHTFAQLNLQGPRSRAVLSMLTDDDVSNLALPYRGAVQIVIQDITMWCVRITYLGELGYELYPPAESAGTIYDAILEVGRSEGVIPVGLKALGSLRLEKGYRDYGHDIDNTDCPLEAGLSFAINWEHPFVGRDALAARHQANQKRGGLRQRLVQIKLRDPDPLLFHAEPVFRNGRYVGYVRAGSYGWTLGASVGLVMVNGDGEPVTAAWLAAGEWEVAIAGVSCPAQVSAQPFYDPTNARVK
jgi:glycine cleavage system aminomethyltransferase T/glycine/D-amino acid oxidase-like deaminating enzyme